jgi:hypothetical protein
VEDSAAARRIDGVRAPFFPPEELSQLFVAMLPAGVYTYRNYLWR